MSECERINSEAETELRQLDNLLARRPALPGKSRLDDVAFMLAVLKEADPSGEVGRRVLARQGDAVGLVISRSAASAPALASAQGEQARGVWEEVRIPVGRLHQQVNDHKEKALRASRREDETADPVVTAYCAKVASLHMQFAGELLGLLPAAPAGAE